MLRVPLLLMLLTHGTPAFVTETSLADRIDKLYEKLEKYTVPSVPRQLDISRQENLYKKIKRLNALTPDKSDLSDEDEELLTDLQMWGLNSDQLEGIVKDLQKLKDDDDDKENDYVDGDWNDEDLPEYPMDEKNWDSNDDVEGSTSKPLLGVSPSAFTRIESSFRKINVSAVDPIAATNERPTIVYESAYPPVGSSQLRQEAVAHYLRVRNVGKCQTPQARWLEVRQMAPAADTSYLPPYVELYRCAFDVGCCFDDYEICAPIEGNYVALPFFFHKADGRIVLAKMQFFNHTKCECVSRETLQSTVTTRIDKQESLESRRDLSSEGQNDSRMPTEEPKLGKNEDSTAPPQLRRCTCPGHFLASNPKSGPCSCVCDWPDVNRRRDCQSLAKGKEHFGMRDRVCVSDGHCMHPTCEYGAYDRENGRCPTRKFRRLRSHARGHHLEKAIVV